MTQTISISIGLCFIAALAFFGLTVWLGIESFNRRISDSAVSAHFTGIASAGFFIAAIAIAYHA